MDTSANFVTSQFATSAPVSHMCVFVIDSDSRYESQSYKVCFATKKDTKTKKKKHANLHKQINYLSLKKLLFAILNKEIYKECMLVELKKETYLQFDWYKEQENISSKQKNKMNKTIIKREMRNEATYQTKRSGTKRDFFTTQRTQPRDLINDTKTLFL